MEDCDPCDLSGLDRYLFRLFAFFVVLTSFVVFLFVSCSTMDTLGQDDDDLPVPHFRADKIVTIDPGVHLFPPTDFPETLAKWIKEHPEHMVCAMSVHADGYIVVTKVDPKWLNNVLPGGARPPMGMSRPDQE